MSRAAELQACAARAIGCDMSETDPKQLIKIARENGSEEFAEPLDLGSRVRDLRKARNWTLEQAAQQAGLARSTLSKIENGQMSPTYDALKKLAVGLDISVPQLFTPPVKDQINGRMVITKNGQGTAHATATYEHELLADGLTKKQMLPYRARVRARSIDEFDGWVRHDGEEFLYVLTGVIRLYTEFYEPIEMRRGDTAYYDASMGHNVVSLSDEDATILWVTALT
jgi:transcriptional regulator with XRE-family HTH domain